jgi:hypothetical protein
MALESNSAAVGFWLYHPVVVGRLMPTLIRTRDATGRNIPSIINGELAAVNGSRKAERQEGGKAGRRKGRKAEGQEGGRAGRLEGGKAGRWKGAGKTEGVGRTEGPA